MRILEEFNVRKQTFEWGGVDYLPLPVLADALNLSCNQVKSMFAQGSVKYSLAKEDCIEEFSWEILELLVHEEYHHFFNGIDKTEDIWCLNRAASAAVVSEHARNLIDSFYAPYNNAEMDFKKIIL